MLAKSTPLHRWRSMLAVCRAASKVEVGKTLRQDARPSGNQDAGHVGSAKVSASPDMAIQDLEVVDLVGAGGYGNVYRYCVTIVLCTFSPV